jgi:2-keto-4-pentenoate hydratase/2-oxohepta-3-ene-1,7-dioic acid hydratase in catechol pathway
MQILFFKEQDALHLGIKTPVGIIDITETQRQLGSESPALPDNPAAFFAKSSEAVSRLQDFIGQASLQGKLVIKDEATLTLAPSVPAPGKIICVGLNYRRHAAESNMPVPKTPVLFSKFNNAVAACYESIPLPASALQYDYEAELAVVIGKTVRDVAEADALNYVVGYCAANDLSARELQSTTSQWLLGKTLDKFMPIGPYLVTTDEIPDPQMLGIRCLVNGEQRQNSNTSDMVFTVQQIISYISRYFTLDSGDVILTGTPEGVVLGMKEKIWLKAGDEVQIELDKLGCLVNRMV